ncbi:hypothetical protein [Sphingobacterium sp. B29]|uniref:hypothetical protein n=1 Tax=Sphingobacterium sp. B29 TaxID=1933220 RepID=UPI001C12A1B6|nr:hypothetical protein [Sphingobacterium sp. B29]
MKNLATYYVFDRANTALSKVIKPIPPLQDGEILVNIRYTTRCGIRLVGTGIGVMNMFAYVFAAVGEPLFGKLIDYTGNTANIFLFVALICAICATIISFVQSPKSISIKKP